MRVVTVFLHRFLSPFLAGCLVAGATLAEDNIMVGMMVLGSALLLIANFSFNSRMIDRIRAMRGAAE